MGDFPPGYRFYPTEEELVSFYLSNKVDGGRQNLISIMRRIIPDLDIYEFNPWDLPQFSGEMSYGDPEQWFFFVPRQEVEARGGRPKRLTTTGYWKATGSPGFIYSSTNRTIGMKRTMVFYKGRAPKGTKTQWKMNEYKLMEGDNSSSSSLSYPRLREEFSLCRVYKKSKCLRAFDRRPVGVEIMMGEPGVEIMMGEPNPNYEDQQAHDNDGHNPPLMLDNFITSSPNNVLFHGDSQNHAPSQTNWHSNVITTAASNNETACDWEMLAEWEEIFK